MADLDITSNFGTVDKRAGRGREAQGTVFAESANATSINALKTRLTALNGTAYTAARLNSMTKNDMLFALRSASADSAGI